MSDSCWESVDESTPEPHRLVKYRTAYYQMIGYLDRLGRWVGCDGTCELLPVDAWRALDT